ncbi:MAG TPA: SDR family oxidoreductase [Acidimicrobiales bacterium]|nr:SDR family oxidoreductase [Acidimicrobiales bacterium]
MSKSAADRFRYDGKRCLVVGGATGMGAAAAQTIVDLGAEVIVLDYAPVTYDGVKESLQVDLRDQAAVDAALAQVGGPVHAIFSAAGVADGTPGLMKINFIAHRHIVDSLIASGALGRGGAVCFISSAAGLGWETEAESIGDFLGNETFASAVEWIEREENLLRDNYMYSKQVMLTYVARAAYPLAKLGIRINAICPGPTDTPLARANAEMWLGFGQDWRDATGTQPGTPEEMGDTMAFLNSDAARGVNGVNVIVDGGYMMSSLAGAYEPGTGVAQFLFGKLS